VSRRDAGDLGVLVCRRQLSTGDALTFPGGEPHTWSNASASRGAEVIWVLVPAPWSGSA
jgi:hypothetical protein